MQCQISCKLALIIFYGLLTFKCMKSISAKKTKFELSLNENEIIFAKLLLYQMRDNLIQKNLEQIHQPDTISSIEKLESLLSMQNSNENLLKQIQNNYSKEPHSSDSYSQFNYVPDTYKEPIFRPYMFGYEIDDGWNNKQYRHEQSTKLRTVTGSYGYKDNNGIYRHVDYIADENGFRPIIRTSEPGTASKNPASVSLLSKSNPFSFPIKSSHETYKLNLFNSNGLINEEVIDLSDNLSSSASNLNQFKGKQNSSLPNVSNSSFSFSTHELTTQQNSFHTNSAFYDQTNESEDEIATNSLDYID